MPSIPNTNFVHSEHMHRLETTATATSDYVSHVLGTDICIARLRDGYWICACKTISRDSELRSIIKLYLSSGMDIDLSDFISAVSKEA